MNFFKLLFHKLSSHFISSYVLSLGAEIGCTLLRGLWWCGNLSSLIFCPSWRLLCSWRVRSLITGCNVSHMQLLVIGSGTFTASTLLWKQSITCHGRTAALLRPGAQSRGEGHVRPGGQEAGGPASSSWQELPRSVSWRCVGNTEQHRVYPGSALCSERGWKDHFTSVSFLC